jgi:L-fucose isomerase
MRVETIDMSEFVRRIERGHLRSPAEFERALAWCKANCPEGKDYNPPDKQRSREQKDSGLGNTR